MKKDAEKSQEIFETHYILSYQESASPKQIGC